MDKMANIVLPYLQINISPQKVVIPAFNEDLIQKYKKRRPPKSPT